MRGCIYTSNRVVPQKLVAFVPVNYSDRGFFYTLLTVHQQTDQRIISKQTDQRIISNKKERIFHPINEKGM
jgi:hypothetical protein